MLVIFDLDDTLVDTSLSILPVKLERALIKAQEAGLKLNFSLTEALKKLLEIDQKTASARETLKFFFEKFNLPLEPYLKLAEQMVYEGDLDQIKILPVPNALLMLKALKQNHSLALVTVGKERWQREKLEKAGIDFSIFSKIEVVENTKESKKSSYLRICADLGFESSDVLVIGDKVEVDLKPAKALGLKTVLMLRGRGKNQRDFEGVDFKISSLLELKKIIKNKDE